MGPEWRRSIFDFYTLEGAEALAAALEQFEGGRLVVHITEMPIKCPVAPLEFTFLADAWLEERGLRQRVDVVLHLHGDVDRIGRRLYGVRAGGRRDGGR